MNMEVENQLFFKCEKLIKKYGIIRNNDFYDDRYNSHKIFCSLYTNDMILEEKEFSTRIASGWDQESWTCIYDKFNEKISNSYIKYDRSIKDLPAIEVLQHIEKKLLSIDKIEHLRQKCNSLFTYFLNIRFFAATTYLNKYDSAAKIEKLEVREKQQRYDDYQKCRRDYFIKNFEISLPELLNDHANSHHNFLDFIPEPISTLNFNSFTQLKGYLYSHNYFQMINSILNERFEINIDLKVTESGLFLMINRNNTP
ncbi:MAG: hypothetical protein ACERKD_23965 [Prolixibacteraceae bacterium]